MKTFSLLLIALLLHNSLASAGEFFSIRRVELQRKPPKKGLAVFREVPVLGPDGKPTKEKRAVFVPSIEVKVETDDRIKASSTLAKAYFFDRDGKLIDKLEKPTPVDRGARNHYAMPVFFAPSTPETILFALPEKVQKHTGEWKALVVFGDRYGAAAEAFPNAGRLIESYDFPEKQLYLDRAKKVNRKVFINPLVEHVIKTNVPEQPQITLFLRPPIGMSDTSEAEGVLAMCVIANSVEEIKRRLQGVEPGQDMGGLLKFAEKHKLVILCWGSRGMRQPGTTWDEIDKKTNEVMEKTFDKLADKWDQGVESLVRAYNLPDKYFLLWGSSDSGQYAGRLALRKPERFLAAHCHIPNGFDAPRIEGNRVLWCLTTGERDFCYERSLRFFDGCKKLGFPIVYKAIIGLEHAGHPAADRLGLEFFEWALTIRDARQAYDEMLEDPFARKPVGNPLEPAPPKPWCELFLNPPFIGDVVNQEVFPSEKRDMVPEGFRTYLPTKPIADAWNYR